MKTKPWYISWPAEVPKSLNYPSIPLHEILTDTARKYPRETAIAYHDMEIAYSELNALSERFASGLSSINVKKGDRVAIFLPNIPQFIIAYYGILKAGAVVTTISPLHKEREVEHQLNDSEAETVITLDSLHPTIENIWTETNLRHEVTTCSQKFGSEIEEKSSIRSFHRMLNENAKPPNVEINP
ncbi:MAG TPA: AMP-binding protein, partial [Candidatus Bathyarchaeia archaeon]